MTHFVKGSTGQGWNYQADNEHHTYPQLARLHLYCTTRWRSPQILLDKHFQLDHQTLKP